MNDFVRVLTQKVQEKRESDLRFSDENERMNNLRDDETRNREHEEKMNSFCGIFENIMERNLLLEEKCDISLSSVSDSEILEKAKHAKILDNEFNKILDWITELIKARPTNYQKGDDVLNTIHDSKNELKIVKIKYQKDLNQEIKNRDLSPEKIKKCIRFENKHTKISWLWLLT